MRSFELNKGWSNWVKLVAAILVAVSHYSTVVCVNNHWSDSAFLRLWCQGGYIGVAFFFFFSGYGLMESAKKKYLGLKDFFTQRFLKVYLPVLMVSVVWIPVFYAFVAKETDNWSIGRMVYDILWGFRDPVLWFVKILFFLYGLFFCFTYLREKNHNILAHAFIIGGTAFATWLAWYCAYPFISVPLFSIGLYSSILKDRKTQYLPVSILLVAAMAVVCAGVFLLNNGDADSAHGVLNGIVTILMLAVVYSLSESTPPFTAIWHISNIHDIFGAYEGA